MKIVNPFIITDAALVSSNIVEPDAGVGVYAVGATYALGDYVIVLSTHHKYRSLQAGNIGHDPIADSALPTPLWWTDYGADNRWKMFDQSITSQSTNPDGIEVVLTPTGQIVDSAVFLNVSAASVRVQVNDLVEGLVFDQTYDLTTDSGIQDWYAYFFSPVVRTLNFAVTDLPLYMSPTLTLTLSDPGTTVACGAIAIGLSQSIGDSQYGAQLGIQDYSVKQVDAFGNYTILERAFSKRGLFELWVAAAYTSELQRLLENYRATPIIYIGTDIHAATIFYGFYKDFTINIRYMEISVCSLEIEGLT